MTKYLLHEGGELLERVRYVLIQMLVWLLSTYFRRGANSQVLAGLLSTCLWKTFAGFQQSVPRSSTIVFFIYLVYMYMYSTYLCDRDKHSHDNSLLCKIREDVDDLYKWHRHFGPVAFISARLCSPAENAVVYLPYCLKLLPGCFSFWRFWTWH